MFEDAIATIMTGDFFLGLFKLLMAVLITIVNLILYPFGLIISHFMPSLNGGLQQLAEYFNYASTYMGWILNAFAVPTLAITLVASYYFFAFSATFASWSVKLIINWKKAIWG